MVGKIIRNYEIESEIGSGGMGVVYRARNLATGEALAIKVIAPKALEDPERLARFRHEAKIASTLDHPGIVKVFDVGEETIDGQARDFIAMELVEGRTLAERIGGRSMSVTEALGFAIQIASALAAAHAAHIVHRDVKPSNLIVNNFGIVKLADFGLAKRPADPYAETGSVQLELTHDGTIVGSVAYMSPEQARGLPLDSRSDIFSFGAVFYEMLSGRPAFPGATTADKLSAVLATEPQEMDDIPSDLAAILARCLRKDLSRRWQSAGELKAALEDFRSGGAKHSTTSILRTTSARRAWLAAAGGLAAGLLPAGYLATRKAPLPSYQRLTFRNGDITGARFAPGGFIAYTAKWDGEPAGLFTCQPGNREGRRVDIAPGQLLGVTPANDAAVLLERSETLSVVSLGGGEPRPRLERVRDACWSPDGAEMAISRRLGPESFQIEYPVGTAVHRTEPRAAANLRVSPSGRDLAFFEYDASGGDFQVSLIRKGEPRSVLSAGWRVCGGLLWSPDGGEIWISGVRSGEDPKMYAIRLDGRERVLGQTPDWINLQDARPDGRLLLTRADSRLSVRLGETGSGAERAMSWLGATNIWDINERAGLMVFVELSSGQSRNPAIYVRGLDGLSTRLIGEGNRPMISPDGARVVCIRRDAGGAQLVILPAGPGEAALLPREAGGPVLAADWLGDSQGILAYSNSGTFLLANGASRRIAPPGVRATKASPDGRFAAGIANGAITRYPLDQGDPSPIAAALDSETVVRWVDGGVIAKRAQGKSWILDSINPATGARTRLREITFGDAAARLIEPLVVSPSAATYAYTLQQDLSSLHLAQGVA